MVYKITKKDNSLKGIIHLPSSKSESNRALIIRALCDEKFEITNLSKAEDTQVLKKLLEPRTKRPELLTTLDAGAAGTTMRFLTSFFSIQNGKNVILTGTQRMKERPIKILVEALRKLGADIEYLEKKGFPPLKIVGKTLSGGSITMDGSVSSQYISALLMIAPVLKNGLNMELNGEIISRPYINMTLKMMNHFGIKYKADKSSISIKNQKYNAKDFIVESDWSAASYWYEMAAFADDVDLTLCGLNKNSLQGDSFVLKMFKRFGVESDFTTDKLHLSKNSKFKIQNSKFKIDFSDCPDLAQTFAVTCAGLKISAHITGLKTLRIKETDRLIAIHNELNKIGIKTEIIKDDIFIYSSLITPPSLSFATYNDHRMAMAFAPLAMKFGECKIEDPSVVKKSYPDFWKDLKGVGFEIKTINLRNKKINN